MITSIRFQRIPDTLKQGGDSRSVFYRLMEEGLFTKPVKISERCAVHPVHEVQEIFAARLSGATEEQLRKLVAHLHEKRKAHMPESMRAAVALTGDES